jgi:hypothetical protein
VRHKLLLCIFVLLVGASVAVSGVRHFTFLYEANTSATGSLDLENWITGSAPPDPHDSIKSISVTNSNMA